jgi:hypothetical protein
LFPVPNFHMEFFMFLRSSPLFSSRVLPASRLLLRARLCTCRRASAITRWAPSFGMCRATSTASRRCCRILRRQRRAFQPHQRVHHEASDGTYVPRAEFFDLEPGVIDTVRASPLG